MDVEGNLLGPLKLSEIQTLNNVSENQMFSAK
jgi:hypothetical protein